MRRLGVIINHNKKEIFNEFFSFDINGVFLTILKKNNFKICTNYFKNIMIVKLNKKLATNRMYFQQTSNDTTISRESKGWK